MDNGFGYWITAEQLKGMERQLRNAQLSANFYMIAALGLFVYSIVKKLQTEYYKQKVEKLKNEKGE